MRLLQNPRVYLIILAIPVFVAGQVALHTRPNAHPDELLHLDAFTFFAGHAWPPDLNANGLIYSPDGWSRVYNGELVYWVYGRLGAVLQRLAGSPHALEANGRALFAAVTWCDSGIMSICSNCCPTPAWPESTSGSCAITC